MKRKKLWRMVAVGLCSAMLVSSLSVSADSGGVTTDSSEVESPVDSNGDVGGEEGLGLEDSIQGSTPELEDVEEPEVTPEITPEDATESTPEVTPEVKPVEKPKEPVEKPEEPVEKPKEPVEDTPSVPQQSDSQNNNTGSTEGMGSEDMPEGSTDSIHADSSFEIDLSREQMNSPDGGTTYGLNESAVQNVTNERFDWFAWDPTSSGTPSLPGTGMGIKFIPSDPGTTDAEGKKRLLYCMDIFKDSPGLTNGATHPMEWIGWTNRKIAYALFYGPIFYGETARWSPYSTGNWKFDYWVTQMAVHILNGETTYNAVWKSMFEKTTVGGASYNDKFLVMDRLRTVVNDANNGANYSAFNSAGWVDFSMAELGCNTPASNVGFHWWAPLNCYILNERFNPTFTMKGQDWHHRVTYMNVSTNAGYIQHWANPTMHQFGLHIPKAEYEGYERTGKDITVTMDVGIPRQWCGAIYKVNSKYDRPNKVQRCTMLSFESSNDITTFRKTFNFKIPKKLGRVGVKKSSANTTITNANGNYSLKGAVYTVYRNSALTDVAGTITTDANGNGWLNDIPLGTYYIKETKASPGYNLDTKTYTVQASP